MKTKEFKAIAKGAKGEVKDTFSSPFVVINLLNKAAKGDMTKIANCQGLNRENIAKVAEAVKALHHERYAFDMCVLPKAANGRLGVFTPIASMQGELACIMCGESVYFQGKELCINDEGVVGTFVATPLTITAIFNAFCKVVENTLSAAEKAAKAAEKAAKVAKARAEKVAKARAAVAKVFGEMSKIMNDDEVLAKYALIKGVK